MKLIEQWSDFVDKAKTLIDEGNVLIPTIPQNVSTEELQNIKFRCDQWINKVLDYLNDSFDVKQNEYWYKFKIARVQRFNFQANQKQPHQLLTELKEDIKEKINELGGIVRILSVSDAVIKPEQTELSDKSNFSVEQTLFLLLEKLSDLYDDSYYPIEAILKGNGIVMKRHDEDMELGNMLADHGYVDVLHKEGTNARLTLKGKSYVEQKKKVFIENYDNIHFDKVQLDAKINEIIDRLNNLGLGQEILFEELQELKETYIKLSKKSWGQLLKGKLFDLGLAKLVDMETLNFVYEQLTNHELRIPGYVQFEARILYQQLIGPPPLEKCNLNCSNYYLKEI